MATILRNCLPILFVVLSLLFQEILRAQDGTPDPNFGNSGQALIPGLTMTSGHTISVLQPDGKLLQGGAVPNGEGYSDVGLVRYSADGTPDLLFGVGGRIVTSAGAANDDPFAVALQPDGKIIVAAKSTVLIGEGVDAYFEIYMSLLRYTANGSLDNSFGVGGKVLTPAPDERTGYAMTVQPDGKIVIAGSVNGPQGPQFALFRYDADGSLDNSFDEDGMYTLVLGTGGIARAIAVQPDGKIVAAGSCLSGGESQLTIVRINGNGSADNLFNGQGYVLTNTGNSTSALRSLVVQADGNLLCSGDEASGKVVMIRYNTNGIADNTFGGTGSILTALGSSSGHQVAVQPDGKILLLGRQQGNVDYMIARYNSNGSPDLSLGVSGAITVTPMGNLYWIDRMLVAGNGDIYVAGVGNSMYGSCFAAARFLNHLPDPPSAAELAWTRRADVGGGTRLMGTGFSIGEKAYIGLGYNDFYDPGFELHYVPRNDFWEYDPASGSWTQKASFPGIPRTEATALTISGKGYIGLGRFQFEGVPGLNDFWAYDPVANTWTQKAGFGGAPRYGAAGFSINNKGYIGTGYSVEGLKNDFWAYDPVTDAWEQKADVDALPAGGITGAFAFSSGSSGFIGGGSSFGLTMNSLLREYNPSNDSWTIRSAGMPGGLTRKDAIAMSFSAVDAAEGNSICVGMGTGPNDRWLKDLWKYNLAEDSWTLINEDITRDTVMASARGIAISTPSRGYMSPASGTYFYEFNPLAAPVSPPAPSDKWEARADFGGMNRAGAISFSIGSKGYLGAGYQTDNITFVMHDFWEYDPVSNVWTQKADMETPRAEGIGFSVGNKGYVGLGMTLPASQLIISKDFWEYDPASNSWTRKPDFPGDARRGATAFVIAAKGYVGTGFNQKGFPDTYPDLPVLKDLWEYNTASGSWTRKADLPGPAREDAFSFALNGKGYIGSGNSLEFPSGKGIPLNDFYEYNPISDQWTAKSGLPGVSRGKALGFAVGNKGYAGLGLAPIGQSLSDVWSYYPPSDTWSPAGFFNGGPRYFASVFTIGARAYAGAGSDGTYIQGPNGLTERSRQDFWQFTPEPISPPVEDAWVRKADMGNARVGAVGFSIGDKGYIGTGEAGGALRQDFWEYDPQDNTWSQKADFGGGVRGSAVGFAIGTKGYIGTGSNGSADPYQKDFWEYNPQDNTWTRKADFEGAARNQASGWSIADKGYLGTGLDMNNAYQKDFWEYNPANNTWTRKTDFGGEARTMSRGFTIGNMGYLGIGISSETSDYHSDFWEYDPVNDSWTKKADFPGEERLLATAFGIGNLGHLGTGLGVSGELKKDFWEYNPASDTWKQGKDFTGEARWSAVSFTIGDKAYVGTGVGVNSYLGDFWEYTGIYTPAAATIVADYISSSCPSLSDDEFVPQFDNNGNLVFTINPNENNLGATCWGIRKTAFDNYHSAFTWFGDDEKEYGAYLPKNFYISPAFQPETEASVVLVFTTQELLEFVTRFNTAYGTAYTIADLKLVKYNGVNQDLDINNNSDDPGDYLSISPLVGTYGDNGEYTWLQFNTPGFSEFAVVLTSANAALPVKLRSFTAKLEKQGVAVKWSTAQEQNASHFNLLRSTDGRGFEKIQQVLAAGNSDRIIPYAYTDEAALSLSAGRLFYKLELVDLDGSREYSGVVPVSLPSLQELRLNANPVKKKIQIFAKRTEKGEGTVIVMDAQGRVLINRKVQLQKGISDISLDAAGLQAGLYFLKLSVRNEPVNTITFIKD